MRRAMTLGAPFVLLIVASRVLSAQGRADLPARLQPASRAAIVRLADSLAAERLPIAPVYDKAAEGALKGADDRRIVAAVREVAYLD